MIQDAAVPNQFSIDSDHRMGKTKVRKEWKHHGEASVQP